MNSSRLATNSRKAGKRLEAGFSLVELMAAMTIFVIVSAAALSLFSIQQPLFRRQQGLVGVNIGLRNALTQLQMDAVNAGARFFTGINIPSSPIGVTVNHPNPGAGCYVGGTYTATCFDTLNVIAIDANTPPINPTAGSLTSAPPVLALPATGKTAPQTAALFKRNDQILFLSNDAQKLTTAVLTADATAVGGNVQFQFNATDTSGKYSPISATDCRATNNNDPLCIATHALNDVFAGDVVTGSPVHNVSLSSSFGATDWILKLAPITYQVDLTDATNPELTRTQSGTTSVVMEQIIGFRVGGAVWNDATATTNANYYYDPSTYPTPYDFSLVRSIRVSLIGRTPPSTDPSYTFRNSFDNGPYQIVGASVVINPRNQSMND